MLRKLKTKALRKLSSGLQWFLKYGEKPLQVQIWVHGSIVDKQVIGTIGTMLRVNAEGGEEFIGVGQAVSAKLYWEAWHAWREDGADITWEDGTKLKPKDFHV